MDNNQSPSDPNNFGGQPVAPSNLPKADGQTMQNQNNNMGVPSMPSGNPFEQGGQQQGAQNVPPPPSNEEENVAIRTMKSDSESIKQTGGDMPKSEIVTAPDINIGNENTPNTISTRTNCSTDSTTRRYATNPSPIRYFPSALSATRTTKIIWG